MTPTIFVLEDDPDIARIIVRALQEHGMQARTFQRQRDFRAALEATTASERPAICLIDLTLPDGNGLDVVTHVIGQTGIPTIIVSGREDLSDRITGLEIGADDYIVKPFEPREMVARIRAVLRRSSHSTPAKAPPAPTRIASFGEWVADFEACTLRHADGATEVLSSAESRLLEAFVGAAGRVLTRAQLLELTTGRAEDPFDRSMDARISRLRRKLRDDSKSPDIIRTVYGAGYVFSLSTRPTS